MDVECDFAEVSLAQSSKLAEEGEGWGLQQNKFSAGAFKRFLQNITSSRKRSSPFPLRDNRGCHNREILDVLMFSVENRHAVTAVPVASSSYVKPIVHAEILGLRLPTAKLALTLSFKPSTVLKTLSESKQIPQSAV